MRLTTHQINGIISAIHTYLNQYPVELRLYGSRVHDHLKGGDIDLLLILQTEEQKIAASDVKHKILAEIKKNIGDQKIDLIITSRHSLLQDAFIKMIFTTSVILQK